MNSFQDSSNIIKQTYKNEVIKRLPFLEIFSNNSPQDKQDRIDINCPDCGEFRAVVYKNTGAIFCNRKGNCKYASDIIKFLNGGDSPRGRRYFEVMRQLFDMANVTFPIEFTPEQMAAYEEHERERDRKQKIFNDLEIITTEFLYSPDIAAAKDALKYLEGRGWPIEKLRKTSIGFYPSTKTISFALEQRGHSKAEIKTSGLLRDDWKGRIVFPIKEHGIIGDFVAGDITRTADEQKKYLRMNGEKAPDNSMLMGLDDAGIDIILVEGFFDYLTLKDAGFENVVALGGNHLWDTHPAQLKKHKVEEATLFLDSDEAGINGTLDTIDKLKNAAVEVYVADHKSLGASKDPDKFFRDHGADKLRELLREPIHGFEYMAMHLLDKHKGDGEWTTARKYKLLDDVGAFIAPVTNSNRAIAEEAFWDSIMLGADLSDETIAQYRQEIQEKRVANEQARLLEAAKNKMRSLVDAGDFDSAEAEIKAYKEQNNTEDHKFAFLLENNTEAKLIEKFKNFIPGVETGYTIGDWDVAFPGGALTVVAGATGHGKTTTLQNFSLGALEKNPKLSAYFFTVEESEEFIEAQFINIALNLQLNDGKNREAIIHYLRATSGKESDPLKFIKKEMRAQFERAKAEYYRKFIDNGRLRIISSQGDISELVDQIKWLKKNTNVGLVCIDYIQLLRLQEKFKSSRQEEVKEICLNLNGCAKQTGLPLVLAAQFNREVLSEKDMSPQRIGEAGDIERASNIVIGMWNRTVDEQPRSEIYFKLMKGRRAGVGKESIIPFNGNAGVIQRSNLINPATLINSQSNESLLSPNKAAIKQTVKEVMGSIKY